MSAPTLKQCPQDLCARKKWGRGKVRKKISAGAGLLFKGSGFYITDYRSENYKQSAKNATGDAKASGDTKAGGEAKAAGATKAPAEVKAAAETKPAAKPAAKAEKK